MFIAIKEVESEVDGLVTFKDGSTEQYSSEWAKFLMTEEAMDEDRFRFYKVSKVVSNLVRDFQYGRFTQYEMDNSIDMLNQTLDIANKSALCELFGIPDDGGVPDPKRVTWDVITKYALNYSQPKKDG